MATSLGHLRALLDSYETASDLFRRLAREPIITGDPLLDGCKLRPGHMLEVEGLSGSGKTQVLLQYAAAALIPPPSSVPSAGTNRDSSKDVVVWFDMDLKFRPSQLHDIILARLSAASRVKAEEYAEYSADALAKDALSRLLVVRPNNSSHFCACLKDLPSALLRLTAASGATDSIPESSTGAAAATASTRDGGPADRDMRQAEGPNPCISATRGVETNRGSVTPCSRQGSECLVRQSSPRASQGVRVESGEGRSADTVRLKLVVIDSPCLSWASVMAAAAAQLQRLLQEHSPVVVAAKQHLFAAQHRGGSLLPARHAAEHLHAALPAQKQQMSSAVIGRHPSAGGKDYMPVEWQEDYFVGLGWWLHKRCCRRIIMVSGASYEAGTVVICKYDCDCTSASL